MTEPISHLFLPRQQTHPLYTPSSCHIFQHDLTLPLSSLSDKLASPPPEFGDPILPGSFDIVSCVFVLSALPPHKQAEAVKSLISVRSSLRCPLSLSFSVSWTSTRGC